MPKVDVAVEAAAAGLSRARSMRLSDADMDRSIAALKTFYGPKEDGTALTDAEAVDKLLDGYERALKDIVLKVEREAAKSTAEDGVTEISVS